MAASVIALREFARGDRQLVPNQSSSINEGKRVDGKILDKTSTEGGYIPTIQRIGSQLDNPLL